MADYDTTPNYSNCILCGWNISRPYRGIEVPVEQIINIRVGQAERVVHAACLLRDGESMGHRMAVVLGMRDDDDALTAKGQRLIKERYA